MMLFYRIKYGTAEINKYLEALLVSSSCFGLMNTCRQFLFKVCRKCLNRIKYPTSSNSLEVTSNRILTALSRKSAILVCFNTQGEVARVQREAFADISASENYILN